MNPIDLIVFLVFAFVGISIIGAIVGVFAKVVSQLTRMLK